VPFVGNHARVSKPQVRIGVSGWRYEPWRGVFYPDGLAQRLELRYAATIFRTLEINGSFYSLQRPESWRSWYADTPDCFVFAVKGPRFITHMLKLKGFERPLANFLASGVLALEEKLGPILWQFPPNLRFDTDRFAAFFGGLPRDTAAALVEAAKQASAMTDIGPRSEEIRGAQAQLQQMKAALDYANTQLAATEIKSPIAGTVLERIVERGEMVSPSAFGGSGARTSVVDLADLTDLQIELDISQSDFSRLKMSQRAEIIPDAFPNLRYHGYIAEIAPEANRAKSTVQIKVKVEDPNEHLRPEMNARVNFLSDKPAQTNAPVAARVLVPKQAVVRKDGGSFVFVVKNNKVEQRTIRTGDEMGDAYFVLDGLSGNESVATSGVDKLRDGDRVKVQ